jgi:metal-responsive CopG/Arc/MetJ family transcriptional regulator
MAKRKKGAIYNILVQFKINKELNDMLVKSAAKNFRTRSQEIRVALIKYLEKESAKKV